MHRKLRTISQLFVITVIAGMMFITCSKKSDNPITPPPDNSTVQDTIRPIVFVHGRLGAADTWSTMIHRFRFNGNNYPPSYMNSIDFKNYYGASFDSYNISVMADQLDVFINAVIQQTGFPRVDIVAHDIGVQAVQYYITKKNGVNKVAHFAACGGIIDNSLVLNGTLIPTPVKYLTITSDGTDATQNGDATKGTFAGVTNQTLAGWDHQQILCHQNSFKAIYAFFTGKQPKVVDYPLNPKTTVTIGGKVINFIDNTPISGAVIKLQKIDAVSGNDQVGTYGPFTTDANGNWGPLDVGKTDYLRLSVTATSYHEMHVYRQPFRDSSYFERVRMIPKTNGVGSPLLQAFASPIVVSSSHTVILMYSPNRAIYDGRNVVSINTLSLVNSQTCPAPGSSASGSNTMWIVCFDDKLDQKTSTGPMPYPILNTYGINSFDIFISAVAAGQSIGTSFDSYNLNLKNWKSSGTPQNNGITTVQYDNFM